MHYGQRKLHIYKEKDAAVTPNELGFTTRHGVKSQEREGGWEVFGLRGVAG